MSDKDIGSYHHDGNGGKTLRYNDVGMGSAYKHIVEIGETLIAIMPEVKCVVSFGTMRKAYRSVIEAIMLYGAELWCVKMRRRWNFRKGLYTC